MVVQSLGITHIIVRESREGGRLLVPVFTEFALRSGALVTAVPDVLARREFDDLEELTPRDEIGYGCDEGPAAECDLGPYE